MCSRSLVTADFAQFTQNASRIDPHTYTVVYLDEPKDS
jgi:hypothetical protein